MNHWNQLDPLFQGEFNKGTFGSKVNGRLCGRTWKCYWRFLDRDTSEIGMYSEYTDWVRTCSKYDILVNVFDWE